MRAAAHPVPDHVPEKLVGQFNLFTAPGMEPTPMGDPHAVTSLLHSGPPIFFAPGNTRNGEGTWVAPSHPWLTAAHPIPHSRSPKRPG